MPVTWTFDPATRRATLRFVDPYDLHEWTDAMRAILDAAEPAAGFQLLVDRRNTAALTPSFVRAMARYFEEHAAQLARVRAAVVVDSEVDYGMARMTSSLSEHRAPGFRVDVFYDLAEAERWLTGAHAPGEDAAGGGGNDRPGD